MCHQPSNRGKQSMSQIKAAVWHVVNICLYSHMKAFPLPASTTPRVLYMFVSVCLAVEVSDVCLKAVFMCFHMDEMYSTYVAYNWCHPTVIGICGNIESLHFPFVYVTVWQTTDIFRRVNFVLNSVLDMCNLWEYILRYEIINHSSGYKPRHKWKAFNTQLSYIMLLRMCWILTTIISDQWSCHFEHNMNNTPGMPLWIHPLLPMS